MIRAWYRHVAQRPGLQSSLCDPERTLLPQEFRYARGARRFCRLAVQLPLELSDALSRVAQRPELLQLIDDLLQFVVNHGGASFPGVLHQN
jgi:hypothetical protein